MQKTVGNYRVIFADGVTYVVPLGKRTRLKEPIVYGNDSRIPRYLRSYIDSHLRYIGYIYLSHAERKIGNPDKPTGQAQHYMGFAKDVDKRMLRHMNGNGAAIMRAFSSHGIPVHIARVWVGDRHFERKLKRQHNRVRLCPICKKGA